MDLYVVVWCKLRRSLDLVWLSADIHIEAVELEVAVGYRAVKSNTFRFDEREAMAMFHERGPRGRFRGSVRGKGIEDDRERERLRQSRRMDPEFVSFFGRNRSGT